MTEAEGCKVYNLIETMKWNYVFNFFFLCPPIRGRFFWSDGKKIMDISQGGGIVVCCLVFSKAVKRVMALNPCVSQCCLMYGVQFCWFNRRD